jgi:riboflavin transporter FmnP
MSRSRSIALVALFTSIAVVLNLIIAIPAPYAGFLFYEVWEIPVVLALLLLGFWGGASVAALNSVVLEAVRPGGLPTGPVYNFIAELAMFLGVMLALSLGKKYGLKGVTTPFAATATSIVSRTSIMTVVNAIILPLPYPIGFGSFGVTPSDVPGLLILIAIFNSTITLYTVPIAFSLREAIGKRFGQLLPNIGESPAQASTL